MAAPYERGSKPMTGQALLLLYNLVFQLDKQTQWRGWFGGTRGHLGC